MGIPILVILDVIAALSARLGRGREPYDLDFANAPFDRETALPEGRWPSGLPTAASESSAEEPPGWQLPDAAGH